MASDDFRTKFKHPSRACKNLSEQRLAIWSFKTLLGTNIARNVKRWRKTTLNRIPKYQLLYEVRRKHWDVGEGKEGGVKAPRGILEWHR